MKQNSLSLAPSLKPTSIKMKTATKAKTFAVTNRFPDAEKNILDIYQQATAEEILGGTCWYQEAHDFAKFNADKFGLTLEVVAGILSALSPGTDWDRNKADALQVMANNTSHKCGTYGKNVEKAFIILNMSKDENMEKKFPSDKTFNFYHNIINPATPKYVTIDRHALSIGLGFVRAEKSITTVEYRELAAAYTKVAKKLKVLPQQVQAVTWVTWRNSKGYKSAFTLADLKAKRTTVSFGL